MNSVIVPAHNESVVIERCLCPWRQAIQSGEIEVNVIANGCSDDTAELARRFDPHVRVIETPVGSKTHALNLADAAVSGGPRVYVDADVVMSLESLRRLIEMVRSERALAAAPRAELELSGSSWPVRAYYAVDQKLPWFREGIGNSGVYAISEEGRKRFAEFPNVTTDDGFVRLHFRPEERLTLNDAVSVVTAPATLRSLIAIKTRSHFSKWELSNHCPELLGNDGVRNGPVLLRLAFNPLNWPGLGVYAYVKILARVRCRLNYRLNRVNRWERDDSSRPASPSQVTPAVADDGGRSGGVGTV